MAAVDPLHGKLTEVGEQFAILIHATDTLRAAQALESAAAIIVTLAAAEQDTPRASTIAPLPEGPMMRFDGLSTRIDTRRRVAELVQEHLAAVGLGPARVSILPVDGLADLDRCRKAAIARLFPLPSPTPTRLAPRWIDLAADWVFGDQRPDTPVRLRILGVERTVPAAEAAGVLHACAAARAWCDIVTGDVETRVRTASISFGVAPHVAIGGGGPRCDDDGLIARFELLREVVAEVAADCAYACLDFEETFLGLGLGVAAADWGQEGGASPTTVVGLLADQFVPDVYGFQLLGPDHRRRLDAVHPGVEWGTPIGDHLAVSRGEPIDWLITSEVRADVRADGWEQFRALLLLPEELSRVLGDMAPAATEVAADQSAPTTSHGVLDFGDVVIEAHPHPLRGTRLTVLELAAWTNGDPHTDEPASVSPVLRRYVRHLGVGLDPVRRQSLKQSVPHLVDTAVGEDDEVDRSWQLADWLVRRHAPTLLRGAGLAESADRLAGLPPITDPGALARAVTLLSATVITASRRLELTIAVADANADTVEQIAWDQWESVAETTGWAAASEAINYGMPADVADMTDQRVVDASRDPHERGDELDAAAFGRGVWEAAREALAATAWSQAWDRCEAFVRHESTFSINTTILRSLETVLGTDDDLAVETTVDDADRAARDGLAVALVPDAAARSTDFWVVALAAVRASGPAGAAWCQAFERSRDVLGAVLFDDAIAVARADLDASLRRAPDVVGRAVAGAVAREAAGVSARAIAARAAAGALADGRDADGAAHAAADALAPAVADLADDAIALIERLSTHPNAH